MKGAIFDIDGTLVDSLHIWDRLAYDYLRGLGYSPNPSIKDEVREMNLEESALYMKEKFQIDREAGTIVKELKARIRDYYENRLEARPGLKDHLDRLRQEGVALCIGTTIDQDLALPLLRRLGIYPYFKFIQTEENSGLSKRDPAFFKLACQRLASPPEASYVYEDSYYALRAAWEAGLKIIALGDRQEGEDREKIGRLADYYVSDFNELEEII